MLSSQAQHHQLSVTLRLHDRRYRQFSSSVVSTPLRRHHFLTVHSSVQNPDTTTTSTNNQDVIFRKHNDRSTALLLQHLSHHQHTDPIAPPPEGHPIPEEDKVKLLEMSLIRKRTPQFPGSIYVQSPGDADVSTSLPPIQKLFDGKSYDDEENKMLMKALEIRRKVTLEIFKDAMRKGKFGITYTTNLASNLSEFIDYVMIQAASMKQSPKFSESSFNVRARIVIDNSHVVPLIRWLKHNSLSYPQIGKLICMSKGNLDSIRYMAEWLKSIHVKGRYIGFALVKAGGNILERSTEELNEIVTFLESSGVNRDWIGYIMGRCPELLSYSLEEVKSRAQFYFDMGMNENDFGTMVFDFPKVLGYFSWEEMIQKVTYLKEFGLSNEDVGRILAFRPQVMACSIEERWKPLVKYLYYLGISRDGMKRIIIVKPLVFCIDLESNIVAKVQFLRDIGVKGEAIGDVLVRFPQLLTYSLNKKIRPVIVFLLTRAGVSQRNVGMVIALAPELLGRSIAHKLDHNVKYLLSLGIPLRLLGEMISDFPRLLLYNIEILRPKYQYLRRTMIRPLKDLIEFPRFFSYSLEDRIIPRHKVLVENRINFKLRYMLANTEEEFDQRVRDAVERRQRFESRIMDENPDSQTDHRMEQTSVDPFEDDCHFYSQTQSDISEMEDSQNLSCIE